MGEDYAILVAKYGLLTGAAAYALSLLLKRWLVTKEDVASAAARVDVIDLLTSRVKALEDAVKTAAKNFDEERKLRLDAEAKVAALLIRIGALESQIKNLGHDPH